MSQPKFDSETKQEYKQNESEYFKNLSGPGQGAGLSATDRALIDQHLPSAEQESIILDRFERGFTKSSRSGAFSKPGAGPAIFPNGLDFASKFIDDHTPKREKPKPDAKPLTEQTRRVDVPPPAATITMCLDCEKQVDTKEPFVGFMTIMMDPTKQDKYTAMGVKFGDIVIGVEHHSCLKRGEELGKNATPLVLAFGGELTSAEDIRIAAKYGFPVNLHNCQERTLGQWQLACRKERMEATLERYLLAADKNDPLIFNAARKKDA